MSSKEQRRRELARAKWERQQQRRVDRIRRNRRRNVIIAAALVVLVAGGGFGAMKLLGGDDETTDQASDEQSEATDDPSTAAEDPCEPAGDGFPVGKQWDEEPEMTVDTAASYVMTLQTTCGDIEITMDPAAAPHTVNSFDFLAGNNYFDSTVCHRLTDEGIFVLQCGDPEGTGQGGPGYSLPDENLDAEEVAGGVYPKGTVAMANSGPDTGGSQFFLVYEDSTLSADYTPFGTITGGMDVLEKIAAAGATEADPTTGNTAPNATVVINDATVERREDEG
ncbi:peptidylprolyl isomerase [Streptomyces sp. B6B3]|uniref:peptidylprolyl isomerase n=1 Tax=Streptomyces sp. B6B3 TaxID=3153570 RepID=UPI00325D451A